MNGEKKETRHEFAEEGTEICFPLSSKNVAMKKEEEEDQEDTLTSPKGETEEATKEAEDVEQQQLHVPECTIKTISSGNKKEGIIYVLEIDGMPVEECAI